MADRRTPEALRLYRQMARLSWPRSYAARVLLIALAMQLPLLCVIGALAVQPEGSRLHRWELLVALIAVLAGMAAAAWAIRAMLAPVLLARAALRTYLEDGGLRPLPTDFTDDAGLLMRDVAYAIGRWEAQGNRAEDRPAFDALTGLLNRPAALDRLRQTFSLASREGQTVSLAKLDVDQLSHVNERYGHAAGDRVLSAISGRLRAEMRGGDWAARWDGDEFLLLLYTDLSGASIALERLRAAVEEIPLFVDGNRVHCTVSAGGAAMRPGEEPSATLHRVDVALYRAKNAGYNCVRFHGPTDEATEPPVRPRADGATD
jgi:diguanylate cyclase (GGDEF)-like protein